MKTLKINDIKRVPVLEVEPGMILAEGIVIGVQVSLDGEYQIETPLGFVVPASDTIQVYARLNRELVSDVQDAAYAAQRS